MPATVPINTELQVLAAGDVAAALDAAQPPTTTLHQADDRLVVAHRNDQVVTRIDLERYQPRPSRPRGTVMTWTADSFLDACEHRANEGDPVTVYADPDACALTAVLNDDYDGVGGWRDHRILLVLKSTPEWIHWTSRDGAMGDQETFAAHLEQGEDEIIEPSAIEMLEIAQTLHGSTSAKFRKVARLSGRTQFLYEEDSDLKAGDTGEVKIPERFTIRVRPFYGAQAVDVTARLRWSLKSGQLTIGYDLKRPDEVLRMAFATDVLDHVRGALDGRSVPIIEGDPADRLRTGDAR